MLKVLVLVMACPIPGSEVEPKPAEGSAGSPSARASCWRGARRGPGRSSPPSATSGRRLVEGRGAGILAQGPRVALILEGKSGSALRTMYLMYLQKALRFGGPLWFWNQRRGPQVFLLLFLRLQNAAFEHGRVPPNICLSLKSSRALLRNWNSFLWGCHG